MDLDTLKTVLRGLVVSNPGVSTIETLCRDYRTSEGHELPYRQFGYRSSGDFLRDLRDTLRISGSIVHIVSSEETAHLESLVARQKKGRRKGKSGSGFHRKTGLSRLNIPPRYRQSSSNYSSNYSSHNHASYSSYRSQPNNRNQYSSTGSSHRGESFRNFQNEEIRSRSPEEDRRPTQYNDDESDYDSEDNHYDDRFEMVTPSSYNNFEYVGNGPTLKDVDEARGELLHVNLWTSKGISHRDTFYEKSDILALEEVVDYASDSVDLVCNGTRATVKDYLDSEEDNSISPKMQRNVATVEDYPYSEGDNYISPKMQRNVATVEDYPYSEKDNSISPKMQRNLATVEDCPYSEKDNYISPKMQRKLATVEDYPDSDEDNCIGLKMRRNLKEIIRSYPSGLRCARLPEEYIRRYGVPLDCRQYGYVSVNQMAMALPDIFRCVRVNCGDWILYDAGQPPPEYFFDASDVDESSRHVPSRVLERISSILSTKCRGVNLNDFSVNYMILYGSPLMDEVGGYDTMEDLFRSLDNSILVVREVNGEIMVYPPSGEDTDPNDTALPVEVTWEEIRSTLPPNACKPEDKCPEITLPKHIQFGKYIVVRLGEIFSPWKFWVHLNSPDYSVALDRMMDSMQIFYKENKRKYCVPISHWKRSQHCVAPYDNEWHRATILSIVDKQTVKVRYFDYGTVELVRKTELRLLDKQFVGLPMMAIKAKLSAIKPAKGQKEWSKLANEFFFSLIVRKRLVASVIRAVHSPPFLALALVDTEGGEDIHINDQLVEKGFAEYTSEESNNEWSDDPVEPDYVEVDDGIEKWLIEVNKPSENATNKSTPKATSREASSRQEVSEGAAAPAVSNTTLNSIKPLDKDNSSRSVSATSNADYTSPVKDIGEAQKVSSFWPVSSAQGVSAETTSAPSQAVPSGQAAPAPYQAVPSAQAVPAFFQAATSAYSAPGISPSAKVCRPPPGFKALDPTKAPPGLALQGQNMYFMNNVLRPPLNTGSPNVTPQVQPYNMVNSVPGSPLPFNQVGFLNPLAMRQILMATIRPNAMQPRPTNTAHPWNPAFNAIPYNLNIWPPVANNNVVFPSQYSPQQNWSYLRKPANGVPEKSLVTNNNVPTETEVKNAENKQESSEPKTLSAAKNLPESVVVNTTTLPLLDDVINITGAIPSLSDKMTSKTPSPPPPPPPPPGLTPPPTPPSAVETPAKEDVESQVVRLVGDLSKMSTGEETLASNNLLEKTDSGCHQDEPQSLTDCHPEVEHTLEHTVEPEVAPKNHTNIDEVVPPKSRSQPKLLWKPVDVEVGVVHLLNYKGEAYVSSDELAQVCYEMSQSDFAELLKEKNINIFLECNRKDNEEFFSSLDLCPGLKEIMRSEGQLKLNLIPVKNIVFALIATNVKVPQVVFAFQSARIAFNPNDEYWRRVCENPVISS